MLKKIYLLILLCLILNSCTKENSRSKEIDLKELVNKMASTGGFRDIVVENAKNMEVAEKYGLSINEIEDGYICYTSDENNADRIILIRSNDEDKIENIESALKNESNGMISTWSEKDNESKKVENHIIKTNGMVSTLIISNKAKKIEKIFDENL